MERSFKEALKNRRSHYALKNESPIPDEEIEKIIKFSVKFLPSPFNSQSSRLVLLLGKEHIKFWELVKKVLKEVVLPEAYPVTEAKIDKSFESGYGTVLFFENRSVVERLQNAYPAYQEKFPVWAQQTSAMQQLAVWTMLADAGFGVSLQHYNPLIDKVILEEWGLPANWELIAQMPFGLPAEEPKEKEFESIEERIRIFG